MKQDYSLAAIKCAIETAAGKLFSGGRLSEKAAQARELGEKKGLDLYATAVPWRIVLPHQDPIVGFSETLRNAAKDIYAQLALLEKTTSFATRVTVEIDAARLPQPRLREPRARTIEGG